jgi:hypothetical protein
MSDAERSERLALVKAFVRGQRHWRDLSSLGVDVHVTREAFRIDIAADVEAFPVALKDLATGFAAHEGDREELREWAGVVLGGDVVDLEPLHDTPEGVELLEALSDASAGDRLSPAASSLIEKFRDTSVTHSVTLDAVGFYTEAHRNLSLDAHRDALDQLASACKSDGTHVMLLRQAESLSAGYAQLAQVRVEVEGHSRDRVAVSRQGTQLVLEGGSHAMGLLGEALRDLSALPEAVSPTGVAMHVDLTYFEGNELLEDTGYGLTVTLVDVPTNHD